MGLRRLIAIVLFAGYVGSAQAQPAIAATEKAPVRFAAAADSSNEPRGDWPCWRGASGTNHSGDEQAPVEWSSTDNVLWKVAVPGRGYASPCIVGDHIFLPSADDKEKTQFLLCFARDDGHLLWREQLRSGGLPPINKFNSHASATAACDGESVYVALVSDDQLWVSAVSLAGELLWQQSVGGYQHANGFGASPLLHGNLVIVASDNQLDPAIVALNGADGTTAWKTERRKSDNSATPVVGTVAGRKQLLLNGAYSANSYDPDTGKEIWHVSHGTEVVACTMAFDDENVYASGNVPEKKMLAVRGDGQGDVTGSHVLWTTTREVTYVPSPICVGKHLFIVNDSGTAFCRDSRTGKVIWKERLGGNFFSSPVLAAGNLYATNDAGVTYVFRAGPEFELVAKNDIGETCMATPVFCGGRVYLRTSDHLYCIGSGSSAPSSAP